jgi:hypothetical protein
VTTTSPARTTAPRPAAPPNGGGLPGALAAEWTKLWGLRSTWTCAAAALLVTAATAGYTASALDRGGHAEAMTANGLFPTVVMLSQFGVVALAALVITGEYATGAIRSTLGAVPRRGRVLAAKTAVTGAAAFALGCGAGAVADLAALAVYGDRMIIEAAPLAHAVLGTGYYTAAIALFTLGLGAVLRGTAGAVSAAIGVLIGVPFVVMMVGDPDLADIAAYLPADAGMALMTGITEPYGWPTAAALLTGWAAATLAAGYAALRWRDA